MRYEDYRAILRDYCNHMPKDDAVGGIGFVFEQLIELLSDASKPNDAIPSRSSGEKVAAACASDGPTHAVRRSVGFPPIQRCGRPRRLVVATAPITAQHTNAQKHGMRDMMSPPM
jgi:hypothetical protein